MRFLSIPAETISAVPFNYKAEITCVKALVLCEASFKSSTTTTSPALSRSLNALRTASARVFLEIFLEKSRGLGPKTTPPPTHNGDRKEPARARPVPFFFHGFLFVPATSPAGLVVAVALRRAG